MFNTDNCDFAAADREILNEALEIMLADVDEDTRDQAEKSYSDMLNNHWTDGVDLDTLLARVGHKSN